MMYLLTFALGALVAWLWMLRRMRRHSQALETTSPTCMGAEIAADKRTIKKQEAALRLLGVIETSAKVQARQNGGTRR